MKIQLSIRYLDHEAEKVEVHALCAERNLAFSEVLDRETRGMTSLKPRVEESIAKLVERLMPTNLEDYLATGQEPR